MTKSLVPSLNKMDHENELIKKVFFYGDYLADQTASGEEESGIRLSFDLDETLTKEEVEELFGLCIKGLVTQEKFYDARDN
jgi:hypothetical protein